MARSKKAILEVYAVTKNTKPLRLGVVRRCSVAVVSSMKTEDVVAQIVGELDVTTSKKLVVYDGRDGMKKAKHGGKQVFFPDLVDAAPDEAERVDDAEDADGVEDVDGAEDVDAEDDADEMGEGPNIGTMQWPEDQPTVGLNHAIEEAKTASLKVINPVSIQISYKLYTFVTVDCRRPRRSTAADPDFVQPRQFQTWSTCYESS